MLKRIVHFSLKFRGVVVALACLLVAYGVYVAEHARLDVFPNFVPPEVVVQTEAPGLLPEQIEVLVTRPVEAVLNGLGSLESLRSESISGLSVVTVVFKEGTDILVARQMLAEKLADTAGALPAEALAPVMSPLTSSTMDLLKIGLASDKMSPMDLRTLADWTIKPRLLSVPGVAHCNVFGGEVKELRIAVKPEALAAKGLSISEILQSARGALGVQVRSVMGYGLNSSDVLTAARATTGVMGAGFVEDEHRRVLIQTEGQGLTPEALGEIIVSRKGAEAVRLKDVATVAYAPEPKLGDALAQGKPAVMLAMASQYGANTMEVTRAVEAALEEMKPMFAKDGVTLYPRLHRPATFIENSLRNIEHSLWLGGVLVAVVLFLFLGHFRTAFISITAIPLSLLAAMIVLDKSGVTLNTITLGGLAIAIGEVVDDAIIDVENIFRRLRENQALAKPRSAFRVVLEASIEVRSAVVYATFVVALVFLPVLTMSGVQGHFFAPLALSYILAIMASLGVALTVTPALCLIFFSRGFKNYSESWLQKSLKAGYRKMLESFATYPLAAMAVMVAVCAIGIWKMPRGGIEFLPEFREGHFVLQVVAEPGASMPEMLRFGKEMSDALLSNTNIATVEQQAGRAEQGEDTWEPNQSEFHIELREGVPGREQKNVVSSSQGLSKVRHDFPGVELELVTFLGDRISETLTGESAPVVISIFGDDLDVIDAKAKQVADALKAAFPNAQGIRARALETAPRVSVKWRPEALAKHGFRTVEALEAVQAAFGGTDIAQDHPGNRVVDVVVILDEKNRRDPAEVGNLVLKNDTGESVPLKDLADVQETSGRYILMHDGASRRQIVNCWPTGSASAFVEEAKKVIARKVDFPSGVYYTFTGTAEAASQARAELLLHSVIAGATILLLLALVTGNWRNLLLILANVPFALVGGVLAVYICAHYNHAGPGGMMIGSLVGFVTLFGITMRNSIMMISHFEHLVQQEGMDWGLAAAMRGASERLIPILMTALVTAIGLLPLALGTGEAGREIEGPMAIVILGGLVTSTVLNLLFLPTLALRFGKFTKAAPEEE